VAAGGAGSPLSGPGTSTQHARDRIVLGARDLCPSTAADPRALDLPICEILRVEDGRITGGDMCYDAMSMFAQLGIVEAPAPA
jgi:hypothetical protein